MDDAQGEVDGHLATDADLVKGYGRFPFGACEWEVDLDCFSGQIDASQ